MVGPDYYTPEELTDDLEREVNKLPPCEQKMGLLMVIDQMRDDCSRITEQRVKWIREKIEKLNK